MVVPVFFLFFPTAYNLPLPVQTVLSPLIVTPSAWAEKNADPNMQWFKDEMRISPKYKEYREGIWGMSWAHFLTMVFLIIFFVATLIALYIRNKRTKEILKTLLEEK